MPRPAFVLGALLSRDDSTTEGSQPSLGLACAILPEPEKLTMKLKN
jgi:hypothetical protein